MTEDGGAQLAWHFNAPVIAEAARFKPGDPLIVIYRQTSPKEKRVTAIAFPGTAKSPIYVNMTGDRVVLRSAAGVGDRCEQDNRSGERVRHSRRRPRRGARVMLVLRPGGRGLHARHEVGARARLPGGSASSSAKARPTRPPELLFVQ